MSKPKPRREIVRRIVRVKPHTYQPSKAELEEPIILRKPDGSLPTVDEVVDAVLSPVEIVEDAEA